eukprot:2019333-Pleurochrysis_carterae.AAC.1
MNALRFNQHLAAPPPLDDDTASTKHSLCTAPNGSVCLLPVSKTPFGQSSHRDESYDRLLEVARAATAGCREIEESRAKQRLHTVPRPCRVG